ncbi:MAG: hypothetical protein NTY69_02590 [Methylococcales bacterium]|nr:hypothetical protein [Methylococcales bacterium]
MSKQTINMQKPLNLISKAPITKAKLFGTTVTSMLLTFISMPTIAAIPAYTLREIPFPEIAVPSGATARPVCLGINETGQVACNLEIIQTLARSPIDRLAPNPDILASYAYVWDIKTNAITLLSSRSPNTFDRVYTISDTFVGGSIASVGKPSQGVTWSLFALDTPPKPSIKGPGVISDINNNGDYVFNSQLYSSDIPVNFPGKNNKVQAINNPSDTSALKAAGRQNLLSPIKTSGLGLLYSDAPTKPLYALTSNLSSYSISDLSDDGKRLVINGAPNTLSAAIALNCIAPQNCQIQLATVNFSGRARPYIRLNSVNNNGKVIGTDGGIAILINPPLTPKSNSNRVDLNSQIPSTSFSDFGWFLNEAIGINNDGNIVGVGLKGGKNVAFLLSPI